jgi:hypothetical protein
MLTLAVMGESEYLSQTNPLELPSDTDTQMEKINRAALENEFEQKYFENRISRVVEKRDDGTTWESCGYVIRLADKDNSDALLEEDKRLGDFTSKATILGFRSAIGSIAISGGSTPRAYFFLERTTGNNQ